MLTPTLPFEYARLVDATDRVRRAGARPHARTRRATERSTRLP